MAEKEKLITGRFIMKHDTETNWQKAVNFTPKRGEIIIYEADETHESPRLKIGDGVTKVNDLAFVRQPMNWNANEGEDGYIENRTHYVVSVDETVVLPETTLTKLEDDVFIATEPLSAPLVVGMECTVKYNGAEYKCPVKVTNVEGMELFALGNLAQLGGEDTGEPFVFAPYPVELVQNGGYAQLTPFDSAESVTIEITAVNEVVKTIDPKYLGDGKGPHKQLVTDADGNTIWDDRLAYSYNGEMEIMPTTTLNANENSEIFILEPFAASIVAGNEYTVTYNGADYKTVAWPMDLDGLEIFILGNYGAMTGGTDTGEPFVIMALPNEIGAAEGVYGQVMPMDGATSATVKIVSGGEVVKPIEYKYFPSYMYGIETIKPVKLLDNVELVSGPDGMEITTPFAGTMVAGQEYKVTWNSVEYFCTAFDAGGNVAVGKNLFDDVADDYPFTIAQVGQGGIAYKYDGSTTATLTIQTLDRVIHKVPEMFLPEIKTNLKDGVAEGSLRTIGSAKEDDEYTLGDYAFTQGYQTKASGGSAHAEGQYTTASGYRSHAEGWTTIASGDASHAEGDNTKASGYGSHAEGKWTESPGQYSHAEGENTIAHGRASHAEGMGTHAQTGFVHVIGTYNRLETLPSDFAEKQPQYSGQHTFSLTDPLYKFATRPEPKDTNFVFENYELVEDKLSLQVGDFITNNISDTYVYMEVTAFVSSNDSSVTYECDTYFPVRPVDGRYKYVHVVGNGYDGKRSNAHTLDWSGNAWYQGNVYVGGTSQDDENAKMLVSVDKNPEANRHLTTDAEGNTVWEEKLAYEKTEDVVIVPETVLTRVEEEGFVTFRLTEPLAAPLTTGMICEVTYNGMAYRCPVREVANEDMTVLALGNVGVSTGGADTGEPFVFALIPDSIADQNPGVYAAATTLDGAESVTIAITAATKVIKTIDSKYLGSNNGTYKQLVTDSEGNAVWEDKTHWTEKTYGIILPETTLTPMEEGTFVLIEPVLNYPSAGEEYVITWNGVQYSSICKEAPVVDGITGWILGNGGLVGFEDTGEPFAFIIVPEEVGATEGFYAVAVNTTGANELICSVTGNIVTYHKIDKRFLHEEINKNLIDGKEFGSLRAIGAKEEDENYSLGQSAFAEGEMTEASGLNAHAEGAYSKASGESSHAEGMQTEASSICSHAEGGNTKASGPNSHAEGFFSEAQGDSSHAEGRNAKANELCSHAEGIHTTANGKYSHAEGSCTITDAESSHTEGFFAVAKGIGSHAEGNHTLAIGDYSHVEGSANKYVLLLTGEANATVYTILPTTSMILPPVGAVTIVNRQLVEIIEITDTTVTLSQTLNQSSVNRMTVDFYTGAANGKYSHAEGLGTTSNGEHSHAEGNITFAQGKNSHAEGYAVIANGQNSHAEGGLTITEGANSHAEGSLGVAIGVYSHVEGTYRLASGDNAHAEGRGAFDYSTVTISGEADVTTYTYLETNRIPKVGEYLRLDDVVAKVIRIDSDSHTLTTSNTLSQKAILSKEARILIDSARGNNSHAEGVDTMANGYNSHAEGSGTIANESNSHAEGRDTIANGISSHAEGDSTIANNYNCHAEGENTCAGGYTAHSEGIDTMANGRASHAEGGSTIAYGEHSHAEGELTVAFGDHSHAEGHYTIANGECSHADGYFTIAEGSYQHVTGKYNLTFSEAEYEEKITELTMTFLIDPDYAPEYYLVSAAPSFNERNGFYEYLGNTTIAKIKPIDIKANSIIVYNPFQYSTVYFETLEYIGETEKGYEFRVNRHERINKTEYSKYSHIVGNGKSNTARSNAHTLDWQGNAWYAGDVYVGGTSQDDAAAERLARTSDLVAPRDYLALTDQVTGKVYRLTIENGNLVTTLVEEGE